MIELGTLEQIKDGKNLLGFSGGVDSSALFFLLLEAEVDFDIAIMDYGIREQSHEEVAYAEALGREHGKRVFVKTAPPISRNFEHEARALRYAFFEELIKKEDYGNLLLGHQLNDRLEWLLMRLGKGAGLVELLGFSEVEERRGYDIVRPLLYTERSALLHYLKQNGIRYFIDASNSEHRHERNAIRERFATPFLERSKGVARSFAYLDADRELLLDMVEKEVYKELHIIKKSAHERINMLGIDRSIKELGLLLSGAQREEIMRTKSCVLSGSIAVEFTKERIFVCPYVTGVIPKEIREHCRRSGIPKKIRGYLYQNPEVLKLCC